MSRLIGSTLNLVSTRTEKDPANGLVVVRVYEGTESAILSMIGSLDSDQAYAVDDSDNPLYRLIVRTPDDDASVSSTEVAQTWELLGNDVQKDIYEHPSLAAVSEAEMTKLRRAVKETLDGEVVSVYPNDATALQFFPLLGRGVTGFVVSEYVLRKTQTVSGRYSIKLAFENIERLHTTAQVIAAESIPLAILFSIDQIPEQSAQGFVWRWLKKTPTVTQTAGNKFQITQEYWLDLWSSVIYPTV